MGVVRDERVALGYFKRATELFEFAGDAMAVFNVQTAGQAISDGLVWLADAARHVESDKGAGIIESARDHWTAELARLIEGGWLPVGSV